jgi:flagellar hook-associated protein 2
MSSLSTSIYGSSTGKGVGGLLSGLDTDELVNQMTAATRNKINRQYQAKQKLLYRQEAYREISTKLLSFSNKYFSYSSGSKTNILSPNFFKAYTYKSSSNYVNVTGNADNIKNFEINEIKSVATAASFTSSKKAASSEVQSDTITEYVSSLAGETMTLQYDGKSYNITIDADFGKYLADGKTPKDTKTDLQNVVNELNEQLSKIEGNDANQMLKYELKDNKIEIVTGDKDKNAILTAASNDIIEYLNFKTGQKASSTDAISSDKISSLTLDKDDILYDSNSYITFEYNGVLKKINLKSVADLAKELNIPVDNIDTEHIAKYVQGELNKAFGTNSDGTGKVKFEYDTTDKIFKFSASGDTNVFGVSSISKDLSNLTGIESGDYNRLNKTKPIVELGIAGITDKDAQDLSNGKKGFIININNTNIEIESTMSITDVINKINSNAEAGVKVYYSSTTNTFSVKATETGLHKGVSISDVSGKGNLAAALFGNGIDLNNIIKADEYLEYDSATNSYNIYKNINDVKEIVGVANIDFSSNTYNIEYTDGRTENKLSGSADYIIKPGTDTVMTYTLNGVPSTIKRSTANFTIDEINIELNEKASGLKKTDTPITFDVTNNSDEVVERVKQFIDEYNEIINLISTKTSEKPNRDYAPLNPEQQDEMKEEEIKNWTAEAKKGILFGDRNMTTVLRNMRGAMSGLTDVSSITLSSIGISAASMDTSGKLVLDETKFKEKLLENPDEIANLFTSSSSNTGTDAKSGIALQLQSILRANVGTYGTTGILIDEAGLSNSLTSDKNYISDKIEEYDDKMAELKKSLETERQRYWNQFTALETSLNKLNMQSSWLTDMMGQ